MSDTEARLEKARASSNASRTPTMQINATVLRNRMLGRARLRHLQVFVKIAELGSVKRAAEAIGVAQPSATQSLADLEALLQCSLFLRHSRGMTLTAIGDGLLPLARRFVGLVDESATQVAALAGSASSVVRVASITAGIAGLLAQALPAFHRAQPDVLVQLQEADASRQAALVADGEVDCSICRAPAVVPAGWQFVPLLHDRFAVIAGPQHPLARKRTLRLDDLLGATWLTMPASITARGIFDALFAQAEAPPRTVNVITAAPSMVWAMLGQAPLLALLPISVMKQLLDAGLLIELPLDPQMPFDDIGLLLPLEEPGAATALFATFMKRFVTEAAAPPAQPARARHPTSRSRTP